MNEVQQLDPAALQRLHRLGGEAFVCKMIDLFLDYAGAKIAEARAAFLAGDPSGVEKAVHPLKSSAGNVGAERIQGLAQSLEALAKQGRLEALAGPLDELEQAFAVVKPALQARRNSPSSPSTQAS